MTREVAEKYKFDIDPLMKVADLSVGQMQKVEIMKVLIKGAKIIIMDEPTLGTSFSIFKITSRPTISLEISASFISFKS